MIRYIDSKHNVIACSISGLESKELSALVDRIATSIEENERTDIYVEIDSFSGVDWRAVGEQIPRSLPMLGNLKRFGRIAVVSDDDWVRRLTRIESALLPNISYEVYRSVERDQALAWVEGRTDSPHGPALALIETTDPTVIAFSYDGWLTVDAVDEMIAEIEHRLALADGKVRVLARIGEVHFAEIAPFLKRKYVRFKIDALRRVDRYALVGGPEWLRALMEGLAPILPLELRHFEQDEERQAWSWIGARQPAVTGEEHNVSMTADA